MNSRGVRFFSRQISSPFSATTCLSARIPQLLSQPRFHASLTTESLPTSQNAPPPPQVSQVSQVSSQVSTPSHFAPKRTKTWTSASLLNSKKQVSHKLGTVISAGKMDKVVKVEHIGRVWDKHIRKFYPEKTVVKVCDPRNSCREGDVIEFVSGHRSSKSVRHVVERIVAPFGVGIEERPPVMTEVERAEERISKSQMGKKIERLGKVKIKVIQRLLAEGMVSQKSAAEAEAKVKDSLERHKESKMKGGRKAVRLAKDQKDEQTQSEQS